MQYIRISPQAGLEIIETAPIPHPLGQCHCRRKERSQQEIQYWMGESLSSSKQYDIALKENELLQELIMSQRVSSLKLSALSSTILGKCVSESPNNAQDRCIGSERVIKGYQKILKNSDNKRKLLGAVLGSINRSLLLFNSVQASNKKFLEEEQ
jgi:hypothetical protein